MWSSRKLEFSTAPDPSWHYAGLEFDDVANGAGLGAVFFTQYCPHRCTGCQNPQTWDRDGGLPFSGEVLERLMGYYEQVPFATRLTLSGGDPLASPDLTHYVVSEFRRRFRYRYVWLYTGFTIEEIRCPAVWTPEKRLARQVLELCDVLVDGPYRQEQRDVSLQFRGSRNQRIIDVQKSLASGQTVLWSRNVQ